MLNDEENIPPPPNSHDNPSSYSPTETPKLVRSMVALEDQMEDLGGYFLCLPGSHSLGPIAGSDLPAGTYRSEQILSETEIKKLQESLNSEPIRVHLKKGDTLLWDPSLVYAMVPSDNVSNTRFFVTASNTFQVAEAMIKPESTPFNPLQPTLAYKLRHTSDFRPWDFPTQHAPPSRLSKKQLQEIGDALKTNKNDDNALVSSRLRPYYRTSPPLLTIRSAQLHGLLSYNNNGESMEDAIHRAVIRGIRFVPESHPTLPRHIAAKPSDGPRVERLTAPDNPDVIIGQDKYVSTSSTSL